MDAAAPVVVMTESPVRRDETAAGAPEPEPPGAHSVDLGVGSFLRSGVGPSGVFGVSPFVTDRIGEDVFLRLAASLGTSPASGLHMTWVTGRLDTCGTISGNYAAGSGLQLDVCGGADVGATFVRSGSGGNPPLLAQTLPYIDFGPSVDLRAELGAKVALTLRVGLGLNVARDAFIDTTGSSIQPPLAAIHLELDLSWVLPGRRVDAVLAAAIDAPTTAR